MFSVLTPTYNRKKEINRVYYSLKNQTYRDFEWVIMDDGSTDNTKELIENWQEKENDFKITYHLMPENQGKSYAVNLGLNLCSRPYTIIADSDDSFEKYTLQELYDLWNTLNLTSNSEKIGAIWTLVKDEKGNLIGEQYPRNFWQVDFKERVLNRKTPIAGEKWHCWRTKVLQEFKMYVHKEGFVSESATWNHINKFYDFLCINRCHRIYWVSEEGLINKKKTRKKIELNHYYTSYYHLNLASKKDIILKKHYQKIAFDHMKSFFYVRPKDKKLDFFKLIVCFISTLLQSPSRTINYLQSKTS